MWSEHGYLLPYIRIHLLLRRRRVLLTPQARLYWLHAGEVTLRRRRQNTSFINVEKTTGID